MINANNTQNSATTPEAETRKILHIIERKSQYGYKHKLSTIDAILRVEERMDKTTQDEHVLIMGLTKALDAINRTMLWATLYRKGITVGQILHIRRGRPEHTTHDKNAWGDMGRK